MNEPVWVVKSVQANDDYTLDITFADGSTRRFDTHELLSYPVYVPLKSKAFFRQAHVLYDTVAWSEDIDIAPEYLYEQGKVLTMPSFH